MAFQLHMTVDLHMIMYAHARFDDRDRDHDFENVPKARACFSRHDIKQ